MAKRLQYPIDIVSPFVVLIPYCDPTTHPDHPWHLVHEYTMADPYILAIGFSLGQFPTDAEARLAALSYVALAQVTTDFCPLTHFSIFPGFHSPMVPRWNIYRGQRHEPLIPAIYWDILGPGPPPGYSYTGP